MKRHCHTYLQDLLIEAAARLRLRDDEVVAATDGVLVLLASKLIPVHRAQYSLERQTHKICHDKMIDT